MISESSGKVILNLNLRMDSGGISGLIGIGSSGKTTLFRYLAHALPLGFSSSRDIAIYPDSVHYFPQKTHRFMKFRGDTNLDRHEFVMRVMRDKSEFKLVLIDEPSADEFWFDFFERVKQHGHTCITIISTHNLEIIERYADNIYIMREGSIHAELTRSDFFNSKEEYIENLKKFGF